MPDLALVSLRISSDKFEADIKRAETQLKNLHAQINKVAGGAGGSAPKLSASPFEKQQQSALQYAQALSRLQRSTGDYAGAVGTLGTALGKLEKDSVAALRVQTQIAQIQNQQRRVGAGATFEGFLGGFKNIEAQLSGFTGKLQALGNLPGLSGLGRITSSVTQLSTGVGALATSGGAAQAAVSGLSVAAIGLGVGLAAIVGGGALAVKTIFDLAVAGSDAADRLNDMSLITGVSVEKLSLINAAAVTSGSSLDEFSAAAGIFGQRLVDIAGNSQKSAAFLQRFGIDARKAFEDPEKALLDFGQALVKIESPVVRVAAAKEFLGRAGAKLLPTFQALTDDGGALTAQLQRLGVIIDTETAQKAGTLGDTVRLVTLAFEAFRIKLAAEVGPDFEKAIISMSESLASLVPTAISVAREIVDALTFASGEISRRFKQDFEDLKKLAAIGDAFHERIRQQSTTRLEPPRNDSRGFPLLPPTPPGLPGIGGAITAQQLFEQLGRSLSTAATGGGGGGGGGGSRGRAATARPIPEIAGLTRTLDFLPDSLKAIDERAATVGKTFIELSKSLVTGQRALDPLAEKLRILGPAAAQAIGEFELLKQALSGKVLTPFDRAQLDAARQKAEQFNGALRQTENQFGDMTIRANALKDAMGGLPPIFKTLEENLKLLVRPGSSGIPGGDPGGRIPGQDPNLPDADALPTKERNEYIKRFSQDARRAFDDLFTGLLTGANTLRETFGNFFLSIGEGIARRLSESITDKLFDKFFDSVARGFDRLTNYLGGLFESLIAKILKPVGDAVGGFFGKILGAAFGGGFATGGFIQPGQFGMVGERGPEFAFGGRSGMTIFNQQQMAGAGGYGAPNVTVNIYAQDAQSFQSAKSRAQVERQMANAVSRGMRQM